MNLSELGWHSVWSQAYQPYRARDRAAARVVRQDRDGYRLVTADGEFTGTCSGGFRHAATSREDYPTVGDWVVVRVPQAPGPLPIEAVLPRTSAFRRKEPGGRSEPQVVAANIDHVLLVNGLDGDFNPRRIERYLTVAYDSGANPVIVLNKCDLAEDLDEQVAAVEQLAYGVPVHPVSAVAGAGLDTLRPYLAPGVTVALLGSSGVGKSSLVNALLGQAALAIGVVRDDDSRGRHTTTARELIVLPGGGIVIDTPGMRELQLWDDEGLRETFEDIAELMTRCRFNDCRHQSEPGCAVQAALRSGRLDGTRYQSYLKLQREAAQTEARKAGRQRQLDKERGRQFAQYHRDRRQQQRFERDQE